MLVHAGALHTIELAGHAENVMDCSRYMRDALCLIWSQMVKVVGVFGAARVSSRFFVRVLGGI